MLLTILHADLAVFQDDGLVGQRLAVVAGCSSLRGREGGDGKHGVLAPGERDCGTSSIIRFDLLTI